ncbi:MAG: OsmC family protein [Burkholderiales bacterium]
MSQAKLKETLQKTMAGIKSNPRAAKVVFRAQTQLDKDVRCSAKVRDFPPMAVDEPPSLGGADAAMNPVELMLVALGTCQEIMYAAYAAVMGIELDEVKVDVKGYLDLRGLFALDENVAAGYTKIQFETRIKSSADPEAIKKLADMVENHCPVLDTLTRAVEVSGKVTLNEGSVYEAKRAA